MASKTIVFDLDGTLADTSVDLIEAANWCFRELGHGDVLDPTEDASTAFRGGRAMLQLGFSRVDADAGEPAIDHEYPRFLAAYRDGIDRHTQLYPGSMEAVAALKRAGFLTTICTNKPQALAELLLTRLGVLKEFDALIGADTLPVRKPDAAPYIAAVERAGGGVARSALIGDTITDRDTARAAAVPVVLVTFGPDGESVSALEPDALLHQFADLPPLAERLIG